MIKEKNSLSGFGYVTFKEETIFIPSKQRVVLSLKLPAYKYSEKHKPEDHDGLVKYRQALATYVDRELSGLDGFAAYDEIKRYQITFGNGWHQAQSANTSTPQ